jgi:hypothetical protein
MAGRSPTEGEAAASIHRQLEDVLDAWRRAGTPEATISEAIVRAARFSAAIVLASKRMGGELRR